MKAAQAAKRASACDEVKSTQVVEDEDATMSRIVGETVQEYKEMRRQDA